MTIDRMRDLQSHLAATGRYDGALDGIYGPKTKQAVLAAMEDGPDTPLALQDYRNSAARLGVRTAAIMALAEVEAAGSGFDRGFAKILFEPHRFSKLTGRKFDASNPAVSYAKWGARPYPRSTPERYAQLLEAVGLDPWAGFCAASYGKFQILGENHEAAGYDAPWEFAFAQAYDEPTQLAAFESFIRKSGILTPLRGLLWAEVARRYNGPSYRSHQYDVKLARAADAWERKLAA